ncbi:transporter [Azonexus hydrophilus]|uniref:Transporter n=1 Tax=Azonexus hydrophilus TaxID=418702 RepID=A0A1R1I194_9RHOO|nr:MMPL family transporter [Azonexus hydrophilus]OMG52493.1 transporter [Azonexus hydrophilus]
MKTNSVVTAIGQLLFGWRRSFLALFVLITLALSWSATQLRVDAGFQKMIPLKHEYMQTFTEYQKTFGGANRVLLALRIEEGDIYTPEFFAKLKAVTDEVFFLPGVERASVTSLFTPNVRFIEVVEDGFAGGNVIPADFAGTPEDLEEVRANVLKSGRVGRLVSNDFKGALVSAELLEIDPSTGTRLDYAAVAGKLEEIRSRHQKDGVTVHIIGFAKAVGDITEGARAVLLFFAVAFVITAVLLYFYSGSAKLTAVALICAMIPVIWLLGLLPLLGYGIDPMSILVPFLIFSIGVSHAVQMTNAWQLEVIGGADGLTAAHKSFLKLFMPGAMALLANALGFMVILYIEIDMVRELAITASLGVALMIVTNKMLLTILLSWMNLSPSERQRSAGRKNSGDWLWVWLKRAAAPRPALVILVAAAVLLAIGTWQSRDLRTGDLGKGIPELHDDSRYNRDTAAIVDSFSIGVDVLSVIAQSHNVDGACTDFTIMDTLDRFESTMRNVHGVQGVLSLPGMAKTVNAGWNEGNPRWRVLSRDPSILAQSVTPIDTSTGLLDTDCNTMQIMIFTRDHQGSTIAHVVNEVKKFIAANPSENLELKLASGNVGVMVATNEAVDAAEVTMLLLLFGSIGLLCLLEFRSWRATLCIILPLAIVAVLCNALMAVLGIGLKVSTLPVIALGVGVGVDYGIYLYERMAHELQKGVSLPAAFLEALRQRGTAIGFTAATMAIGVGTWAFSALKFQADMGILLAFMFVVNMLGAILLLPALAAFLVVTPGKAGSKPASH